METSGHTLSWLAAGRAAGHTLGITSVCSAHPLVVEAALRQAVADSGPLLLEATSNQINHEGGYTGLTPVRFREFVRQSAARAGLPFERIVLGGDHLGPNPWRHLPAPDALAKAATTVAAYVAAGFQKIHLDTSMACHGEDPLHDELIAQRAAELAAVAERAAQRSGIQPVYVIGTEVPKPGGATESLTDVHITTPHDALATFEIHRRAFAAVGAELAFERVIALVVQPAVEFGHEGVLTYRPDRAAELSRSLAEMPGLVFEAHSTDYQPPESLVELVRDGFAILKVGPALTFALREALYSLDYIRTTLRPARAEPSLIDEMEGVMLADPTQWLSHYRGDEQQQRLLRHFSYSDRIRYYWPVPRAAAAVEQLLHDLTRAPIAQTLISQFMPTLYPRVVSGAVVAEPRELVIEAVRDVLRLYAAACAPDAANRA